MPIRSGDVVTTASDAIGRERADTRPARPTPPRLGGLLVLLGVTMAMLLTLSALLKVPSGFGVEAFLGWSDPDALSAIELLWSKRLDVARPWVFGAYFTLDTAVFVPVYGLVMLALWRATARAFLDHVGVRSARVARFHRDVGLAGVATLMIIDVVENCFAMVVHGPGWTPVALSIAVLFVTAWTLAHWLDREWLRRVWSAYRPDSLRACLLQILAAALIVAALAWFADPTDAGSWSLFVLNMAHFGKQELLLAWSLLMATQGLWLLFGPHHDPQQRPRFVDLRIALAAIPWRARYVLLALAVCIALMLVMNQGRDVIYAVAARPWADDADAWAWVQTLFVLAMTGLALFLLGYACWLWARTGVRIAQRPRVGGKTADIGRQRLEDLLARDWARLLGVAPALLVLALCLNCLPDALSTSALTYRFGPVLVLVPFAALVLIGAAGFIWQRDRRGAGHLAYYAHQPLAELMAELALKRRIKDSPYRVLWGWLGPRSLPVLALGLAMLCRGLQLFLPPDWQMPSLSLAIVLFELSFWLSLAGWVSLYEHSDRIPWALFLVIWGGAIGARGWSENHEAPLDLRGVVAEPGVYFAVSALLAVVLILGYWLLSGIALAAKPGQVANRRRKWTWFQVACLALTCALLPPAASRINGKPVPSAPTQVASPAGKAMGEWLAALCDGPGSEDRCAAGAQLPVYVIAAEGGGIRNAYWTALTLARLQLADPGFEQRTFAMSGVSGGAVGLAVYRACRIESAGKPEPGQALVACIENFGRKDLLGPLVGAWFFEDVVARWLPLIACTQPACGFLSRGLWFEQAMAATVPALSHGLGAGRQELLQAMQGADATTPHVPYLLLNSTWVETGERVVASELLIDWHIFPGARDQLALLGRSDLPLVSAAHNSARFPFTNALASVHTSRERCTRDAYLLREARAPERAGSAAKAETKACGHLADGGYFDVAGAQGAFDVLYLLDRCLRDQRDGESAACPKLEKGRRLRLAEVLRPRLLLIRNGVQPVPQNDIPCVSFDKTVHKDDVALPDDEFDPTTLARPVCAGNRSLFVDALGPLITAFNAIGTGSNGRQAVSRQRGEIHYFDHRPGPDDDGALVPKGETRVQTIDLVEDGPLFPLGWHLAATARAEMRNRACNRLNPGEVLGVVTRADTALCNSATSLAPAVSPR